MSRVRCSYVRPVSRIQDEPSRCTEYRKYGSTKETIRLIPVRPTSSRLLDPNEKRKIGKGKTTIRRKHAEDHEDRKTCHGQQLPRSQCRSKAYLASSQASSPRSMRGSRLVGSEHSESSARHRSISAMRLVRMWRVEVMCEDREVVFRGVETDLRIGWGLSQDRRYCS